MSSLTLCILTFLIDCVKQEFGKAFDTNVAEIRRVCNQKCLDKKSVGKYDK